MKHSIQLYKEERYKIISERMIEVDSQIVTKQIKKGREILTCSCDNSTTFANLQICRHKRFFILFPLLESLDEKLSFLISEYKAGKSIMKTNEGKNLSLQVIDDFKKLRRLK